MHLHTTVRVKADSEADAVAKVARFLEDEFENGCSSDWYDEGATAISADVRSEGDFEALRAREMGSYEAYMLQSIEAQAIDDKGMYLTWAGECLWASLFDTRHRLAFDMDWEDGANVYYVATDRHF